MPLPTGAAGLADYAFSMATHILDDLFEEIARLRRESAAALLGSCTAQRLARRALADARAALDDLDTRAFMPRRRIR